MFGLLWENISRFKATTKRWWRVMWVLSKFIRKIEHFPFDVCRLLSLHHWTQLILIHKNIRSVWNCMRKWCKAHCEVTDKNNNVSSESLDRHYHKYPSESFRTRWDISNNVCLNLQNCCYSICLSFCPFRFPRSLL